MAQVRLSDVIIPEVYESYGEVNSPELTAFLSSGIVAVSPNLSEHAAGPSKSGHVPYWLDLDQTIEPNYRNDDPSDTSTPNKIGTDELAYRKSYMHQSWSNMTLVNELLGKEPMKQIKSRTSTYWLRRLQRRIIAIARGVLADNIANDAGDMVINISTEDGVNATEANRFNSDAFINAAFTMGDAAGRFVGIAMHSMVVAQLAKQDDILTEKDSQGNILVRTYKGLIVIMDDSLPVIAGTTSGYRFVSVLFGAGFIGLGVGAPDVPFELERSADKGNGAGMDTIHERKTWLLHPAGYDWIEAGGGALAEFSPTDADLALAAKWDRKYDRKQVPVAFLITN